MLRQCWNGMVNSNDKTFIEGKFQEENHFDLTFPRIKPTRTYSSRNETAIILIIFKDVNSSTNQ